MIGLCIIALAFGMAFTFGLAGIACAGLPLAAVVALCFIGFVFMLVEED